MTVDYELIAKTQGQLAFNHRRLSEGDVQSNYVADTGRHVCALLEPAINLLDRYRNHTVWPQPEDLRTAATMVERVQRELAAAGASADCPSLLDQELLAYWTNVLDEPRRNLLYLSDM